MSEDVPDLFDHYFSRYSNITEPAFIPLSWEPRHPRETVGECQADDGLERPSSLPPIPLSVDRPPFAWVESYQDTLRQQLAIYDPREAQLQDVAYPERILGEEPSPAPSQTSSTAVPPLPTATASGPGPPTATQVKDHQQPRSAILLDQEALPIMGGHQLQPFMGLGETAAGPSLSLPLPPFPLSPEPGNAVHTETEMPNTSWPQPHMYHVSEDVDVEAVLFGQFVDGETWVEDHMLSRGIVMDMNLGDMIPSAGETQF